MASRWPARCRFRRCSTARTACSSWRTTKASSRAPPRTQFFTTHDTGDAERRLLGRHHGAAGSALASDTERRRPFTVTSTPFPGNQIPATRFKPRLRAICSSNFAPLPNLPQSGLPNRNYQYLAKTPVDKDQFTGASTSTRAPNSQWFGRYSWTDELTITPGVTAEWHHPVYAGEPVGAGEHARLLFLEGERIPLRLQLDLNNISQELAGVENVNEKIGHAGEGHRPELLGHSQHRISGSTLSSFGNDANGPFTIDDKVYQFVDNFSWITRQAFVPFRRRVALQPVPPDRQRVRPRPVHSNGSFTGNGEHAVGRLQRGRFPARAT